MTDDPQTSTGSLQRGSLCARVAPLTNIGRGRQHNEDNHLVLPLDGSLGAKSGEVSMLPIRGPGLLLAVADGMGGHAGGDVASCMGVENLSKEITSRLRDSGTAPADLPAALRQAVEAANQAVFAYAQQYAYNKTMGTTLTATLVCENQAHVAQVGDSRAYLFRDGNLILLTQDQTVGNQLIKRGADPSKVSGRVMEFLTQAVGAQKEIDVIMTAVDLEPQDLLLLCSDGLYKVVPPEELVDILELEIPLSERASRMIDRANENGGPDNITVILAEICPVESQPY